MKRNRHLVLLLCAAGSLGLLAPLPAYRLSSDSAHALFGGGEIPSCNYGCWEGIWWYAPPLENNFGDGGEEPLTYPPEGYWLMNKNLGYDSEGYENDGGASVDTDDKAQAWHMEFPVYGCATPFDDQFIQLDEAFYMLSMDPLEVVVWLCALEK
jgi:hypothetical protein